MTPKDFLLDLLFPRFCLGCGVEGTYLCDDCKAVLDISEHKYCLCNNNPLRLPARLAGLPTSPIRQAGLPAKQKQGKCKKCTSKKLSGLYSSLAYKEKPLTRKLIHFFKYEPYYLKDLARPLAQLIIDHLSLAGEDKKALFENSVFVPVPIDRKKLKQRGYNQAEEIAKCLAELTGATLVADVLIKTKSTKPQMELAKEQREKNLQGVFAIQNPTKLVKPDLANLIKTKLFGKKVFLIDDVYTTGSTMEECARVLKKAGAKEVWGIAVARD